MRLVLLSMPATMLVLAAAIAPAAAGPAPAQEPIGLTGPITPAEQRADLEASLAKHRYFSKIVLERVDDYAPFVLYVQTLPSGPETYVASVARDYGPWLVQLDALFRSDVAGPAGLASDPRRPLLPVIVLASGGDYDNYLQVERVSGGALPSRWDERLGAVVGSHGVFSSGLPGFRRRQPFLHRAALALLRIHAPLASPPRERWLVEGLAVWLSFHLGNEPADLAKRPYERQAILELYEVVVDTARRPQWWLSLEELVRSADAKARAALERARFGERPSRQQRGGLAYMLEQESALWVRFLVERHPDAFARYVKLALADQGGPEVFLRTFGAESFAALEAPFRPWLDRVFAEVLEVRVQTSRHFAADVAASAPAAGAPDRTAGGAEPTAAGGAAAAPARFDPAALAPALDAAEDALGAGLWRAAAGDVAGALEAFAAGLGDGALGDGDSGGGATPETAGGRVDRARLERAAERARLFGAARDAFLADAASEGARLRLTIDGRKLAVTAGRVEDGVLHLARAKDGIERVRVDSIGAADLVTAMGSRTSDYGPAWLRGWGLALAGDDRWRRYAREGEGADALVSDLEEGLPALLRTGRAVELLGALAGRELPADGSEARETLAAIVTLRTELGDTPPVRAKERELRGLAASAQAVRFDEIGLEGALSGALERLDGGRVRLSYDFQSPADMDDFENDPTLLPHRRVEQLTRVTEPVLDVGAGALTVAGPIGLVHVLELEAPASARLAFVYESPPADANGAVLAMWGVALTGDLRYVAGWSFDVLEVWRGERRTAGSYEESVRVPGRVYDGELRLDGDGRASLRLDGEELHTLDAAGLAAGRTFFVFHADYRNTVRGIVIEGRPTAASLARLRERWVEQRLAEMGFE